MQHDLTPWFPPHVFPVRKGVYEVTHHCGAHGYAYWHGKVWSSTFSTPERALEYKHWTKDAPQRLTWRGVRP